MADAPSLRLMPAFGKLLLRGDAATRAAVDATLGFGLPTTALRSTAGVGAEALWLGPDEWLLLVPPAMVEEAFAALKGALADRHHALVDVSERFVGLLLDGASAADLLAAGCPLDLHPNSFPPGSATRTLLGKIEIILHHPETGGGYRLYVGRSFLDYAWRFLVAAGREHGLTAAA